MSGDERAKTVELHRPYIDEITIKCPECGHQVSDHAKTCPNCGIEIEGNIKKCPECGEIVFKEADSCQACHHQFAGHAVAPAGSQADGSEVVQVVAQYESDGREDAGRPRGSNGRGRRVTTIVAVAFVIALLVVFGGMYFYQNTQEKNDRLFSTYYVAKTPPLQHILGKRAPSSMPKKRSPPMRVRRMTRPSFSSVTSPMQQASLPNSLACMAARALSAYSAGTMQMHFPSLAR